MKTVNFLLPKIPPNVGMTGKQHNSHTANTSRKYYLFIALINQPPHAAPSDFMENIGWNGIQR